MFYKMFENQYLEEKVKMPIIEELIYERVRNSFPKNNETQIIPKILNKIEYENKLYYEYAKSLLSGIKKDIQTVGALGRFYAFSYELLSEQSQSDYKKMLGSN